MMKKLLLIIVTIIMTPLLAQAQEKGTGLEFASPDQLRGIPLAATPYSGSELPAKVDLSADMPPPGDQGRQNSCVGWATAYALKSYQERIEEKHPLTDKQGNPHPQRVFSPAYIYNQINNGRDGGSSFIDALNLLSNQGAAPWADMPYNPDDFRTSPLSHARHHAKRYQIDYWRQVNVMDPKEIKAHLNAGYPILIGTIVDDGFFHAGSGHIWKKPEGASRGGHAMVLVGYNDTRKAFKLINSWGKKWGDGGFGWIAYDYFPHVVREGYVAKDALNSFPDESKETLQVNEEKATHDTSPTQTEKPRVTTDASFFITRVSHNIEAPLPMLKKYGQFMRIDGKLKIAPGAGKNMQIVVRFFYDTGQGEKGEVVASLVPDLFALPDGSAATGTPVYPIPQNGIIDNWFAFIPYQALNVKGGNWQKKDGRIITHLVAEPILYIDNFGVRSGNIHQFLIWNDVPINKQPLQNSEAALVAKDFFQSLSQDRFYQSWTLLSAYSQQTIVNMVSQLAQDKNFSPETVRGLFDNNDPLTSKFWNSFRENVGMENWLNQTFSTLSINNQEAIVLAQPSGIQLKMFLEQGKWKLGYTETFIKNQAFE